MKSLSSQLIITEDGRILRNSLVQLSSLGADYHDIFTDNHEAARTIFFDGIISPPVIAVSKYDINHETIHYHGFKIVTFRNITKELFQNDNRIIFDFETEDSTEINQLLSKHRNLFSGLNSLDFIRACTVMPSLLLIKTEKRNTECRHLWKGTDLINKKITIHTSISVI